MKKTNKPLLLALSGTLTLVLPACQLAQPNGQSQSQAPSSSLAKTSEPAIQAATYVPYHVKQPIRGYLRSIGSDSMDQVIADWETELGRFHPNLRFRHEGKGTSTAIPALLEQRSDIGPMSRPAKAAEIDSFQRKFGYAPTELPVAVDALAVYVHPENPILQSGLSLEQLERIFSQSDTPITRWGQLGLSGKWTNAPIRLHGRNPASGTYSFFKSKALRKHDFKPQLMEHPGSAEVVAAVGADPYAIGYSGIAYATPEVSTVPLLDEQEQLIEANQANAVSGKYPLARDLFITINLDPSVGPTDLQREFVRFAYSREGQQIVAKVGYFPVSTAAAKERAALYK